MNECGFHGNLFDVRFRSKWSWVELLNLFDIIITDNLSAYVRVRYDLGTLDPDIYTVIHFSI